MTDMQIKKCCDLITQQYGSEKFRRGVSKQDPRVVPGYP